MHSRLATNYTEAVESLRANLTPRQWELENLERYVDGTQYEGRPDFFDDDHPTFNRAPCIVYLVIASAIDSNVDLVLGESRFPEITANPGEDSEDAGGLAEKESEDVDKALQDLFKRVRLHAVARQAFGHAQASKSVATIVGVRKGKPFLENVRSRWCVPTLDSDGTVLALEIRYPYLDWQKLNDGKWKLVPLIYRRTIDAKLDIIYQPVPAQKDGREPSKESWSVATEVAHGLGFCPVVWHAHMRECSTVADIDGQAIHENLLDEVTALDFSLSIRHRASLMTGSPPVIETGVEPGFNPGQSGQTAGTPATMFGGKPSASNPQTGSYQEVTKHPARKIGVGVVWQYESKDSKVVYLTLPDGALTAIDENSADLRNKIVEGLAVVPLDPENVKFAAAMSGKAIETLRARQFDRCDQYRDDFGDGWLLPVVNMLLRVCVATAVKIKSVAKVAKALAGFVDDASDMPGLSLRWPSGYTKADPTDEQMIVTSVVTAFNAKLITIRMAVQKLAPIFGIVNVDEAVKALEKETLERQAKALENATAMAAVAPKPAFGGDKPADQKPAADKEAA